MASLKALKIRINSVKSTQKITKAMKMVAAAKLRRAQDAAQNGRPYAERLEAVMAGMAARVGGVGASPLLAGTGKDDVQLLVVATSERGLAGAFNTNIVRAARRKAEELQAQGKTVKFYIAGKKGRVLKRFFPNAILADHDMSAIKAPKFDDARVIADDLIARFGRGEFDVAHLFYSKFVSALVQDPVSQQLIPVPMPAPTKGETSVEAVAEFEPSEEDILDALLPRNVAVQIFRALLENQAGFYGSQMNAMDNATRNAGDMIRRLSIQYNRTRQAAITTELVEIISGAEAL
ncbi:F0F1 ATP synthase subunit gamma [Sphingomonas pseudosanguinis]|uniref:ATP synthase gamma chain n=1 Tax=Sphingomonas pseudosanguinis TaxID=413712 RepID=A0A7W6AD62_9SPHN|nr:F0F1 ATP synthase subunit gamma [Sphingomonas pseudosanguinis]MBB3880655.1 F-type H+-transporting ATPase subunit gamma [Sphingomonas pseudosanguinis]MBN3535679.1 F0F1 ATP synthase subunit gamma [Sphingomonas pseudosanguinis]